MTRLSSFVTCRENEIIVRKRKCVNQWCDTLPMNHKCMMEIHFAPYSTQILLWRSNFQDNFLYWISLTHYGICVPTNLSWLFVDSLSKNKTLALWPYHFHAALFIVWIRAAMSGHEKNMQQLFTKKKCISTSLISACQAQKHRRWRSMDC